MRYSILRGYRCTACGREADMIDVDDSGNIQRLMCGANECDPVFIETGVDTEVKSIIFSDIPEEHKL